MKIREWISNGGQWVDQDYTDEEILELFPDNDGSLVNPLLHRAQAAEAKIEQLQAEIQTNRLWRKYKELKATIQTCSNENCRTQYVASSPEYPCPWCIIVEKDAKIQLMRAEMKTAYFCLGPDYAGEWELGDNRIPLDSLVSEVVGQLDNARDEIERLRTIIHGLLPGIDDHWKTYPEHHAVWEAAKAVTVERRTDGPA